MVDRFKRNRTGCCYLRGAVEVLAVVRGLEVEIVDAEIVDALHIAHTGER